MRTLAMLALLALLLGSCTSKKDATFDFSPPLKEVSVEAEKMSIDPTKDQVVHFENGTSIDVPKDAFVDQNGNVVTEPVTLALSTYNSPAEILASGIPMAYHDGEQQQDFESAGMFQIKGYAAGQEIRIQEGKKLDVRYPSAVAGEYDFFYLEEHEEDGNKKAAWKKLSTPDKSETTNETTPKGLGDFQLKFDTASYPELAELESIQWRVASKHSNPLDEENAWVLGKKWASIELSQPQYGLGEILLTDTSTYGSVLFSKDKTKIIFAGKTNATVWDSTGKLIKHIDHAKRFGRASLLADEYLLVHYNDGEGIFDMDGKLLCKLEEGFGHIIIPSAERIVFTKRGEFGTTLIYDLNGTKIKEIVHNSPPKQDLRTRRAAPRSLLSPENELIVNSEEGIIVYNLNGIEKRRKNGEHRTFEYISSQELLIEEMDGRLTVWNWGDKTEISSKLSDFSMLSRSRGDTIYTNYFKTFPEANSVCIKQGLSRNDILWNYETGKVQTLKGRHYSDYSDSQKVSQLWTRDRKNHNYVLYDVNKQEVILEIPFSKLPSEYPYLSVKHSEEHSHFLVSVANCSRLYKNDGSLVRDFKAFDSSIVCTYFTQEQLVNCVSENGVLSTWDLRGNRVQSKQLDYSNFEYIFSYDLVIPNSVFMNGFMTSGNKTSGINYFNESGELYVKGNFWRSILDSNHVINYQKGKTQLRRLFKLQEGYQLRLSAGSDFFDTYVFLNPEDQEKLERYKTARAQRLATEKQRREKEAAVVRSFAIRNFGIYNWDRYYKDESRLRIAADFDFGVPTDFNDITVFLVTKANGNSVIKYYEGSWDKFSINPKAENQLLAILPDNKVAYMSNKELKRLDWNSIGERGQHTFAMSISEQPIKSLLQLDEIVN